MGSLVSAKKLVAFPTLLKECDSVGVERFEVKEGMAGQGLVYCGGVYGFVMGLFRIILLGRFNGR